MTQVERRASRSAPTADGPATSAHVPRALRRSNSICHKRSSAATNPCPNQASASHVASICATPHESRRTVTGPRDPATVIVLSI